MTARDVSLSLADFHGPCCSDLIRSHGWPLLECAWGERPHRSTAPMIVIEDAAVD